MKDEWGALRLIKSKYRSDEDYMISAFITICRAALKTCRAAFEQRDVIRSAFHSKTGELVGAAHGESLRKIILCSREHVYSEVFGGENQLF